jgi:hypothetical protein
MRTSLLGGVFLIKERTTLAYFSGVIKVLNYAMGTGHQRR